MKSKVIDFSSEGYTLHGVLTQNTFSTEMGVVLLHPHPLFGGDMQNHVVCALEQILLDEGFSTLRFDFRGSSASPEGYSGVNGAVRDALNAISFLKSNTNVTKIGIVGYSFGASTAIRLALLQPPPFLISLSASRDLISEDGYDIRQISNINCPVLLFHGQSDRMIPSEDLVYLSEIIGLDQKHSILIEGEGHFYLRTLSLVESVIRSFIRDLST